ncbi:MAG: PEP-utilizing enzyme [Dehalococcoidia bacterium]
MTTTEDTKTFPITWDDPADAEQCWRFSAEHMPNAVPPLEFELGTHRFLEGFGWGMRPRQFNYFIYFAFGGDVNAPPPKATPDSVREAASQWRESVLPEILAHTERYRTTDFASMSNEDLIVEIEKLPELRYRSGQLHTMAISPHFAGMGLLIEAYKDLTGGDDLAAMRLVQGYGTKSFDAGAQLWRVGRIAGSIPLVRERLLAIESATALDTLAGLRAEPEAAPFVEALDAYLEEYGWRSNASFGTPTWFEDPAVPLTLLRTYVQTEGYDPSEEQRRLVEEREAFLRETLAALDDAGRARLTDALDAAVAVAPQLEDHNFYLDQRLFCMPRRLVLAAAQRVGLERPNDVFFLQSPELCDALQGKAERVNDLVRQRKGEFAHWQKQEPPSYVGATPPEGEPEAPAPARRSDSAMGGGLQLKGTGVSAGVARGPARVLHGLHQADRLRPGDILITPVTQPTWTPLFTVARAVVTEVGGMLSHTAVASREFGIPAIVNVRGATRLIKDGQLVEVDGTKGTITEL